MIQREMVSITLSAPGSLDKLDGVDNKLICVIPVQVFKADSNGLHQPSGLGSSDSKRGTETEPVCFRRAIRSTPFLSTRPLAPS
jgi:hypothetical protein